MLLLHAAMALALAAPPPPDAIDVYVLQDLTGRVPQATLQQTAGDLTTWASQVLSPQPPRGWGRPVAGRAATPARPPVVGEYVVKLLPGPAPDQNGRAHV